MQFYALKTSRVTQLYPRFKNNIFFTPDVLFYIFPVCRDPISFQGLKLLRPENCRMRISADGAVCNFYFYTSMVFKREDLDRLILA